MRFDTQADAATTPAPTATGPVTRRTFRASRRSSRPRPCGMSWSSTTRSRGSAGSSSSWPASRSATVVTAAAPTAMPTSAFPARVLPGTTRRTSAPVASGTSSDATPIVRLATVSSFV